MPSLSIPAKLLLLRIGESPEHFGELRKKEAETKTVSDAIHLLGLLYADQDKMAEAEKIYQRALEECEKAWGPEHTSTLDTVHNLGNL